MEGLIQLSYLPTESQLADVLTKILPSQQHWSLLYKLGMIHESQSHSQLEGGCWRPSPTQQKVNSSTQSNGKSQQQQLSHNSIN